MRLSIVAALVGAVLAAGPALALVEARTQTQGQTPSQPAPSTTPAQKAAPEPRQSPEGAKLAYIDLQRVASDSVEGKAASAKVKALNDKKVAELNDKNKQLQGLQQKLLQGGTVLSDQSRQQLEREIEKLQKEVERFTQDAQSEVQDLQEELQIQFRNKILPIIERLALDKGLLLIFSAEAGIVWADRGLDITPEVVKRLDATTAGATTPSKQPEESADRLEGAGGLQGRRR